MITYRPDAVEDERDEPVELGEDFLHSTGAGLAGQVSGSDRQGARPEARRQPLNGWTDFGGDLRQLGWISDQEGDGFSRITPFNCLQGFDAARLGDQGSLTINGVSWEGHQPAGVQDLQGFY